MYLRLASELFDSSDVLMPFSYYGLQPCTNKWLPLYFVRVEVFKLQIFTLKFLLRVKKSFQLIEAEIHLNESVNVCILLHELKRSG